MKKIIHEIRRQPEHVRELATILCTLAVVAVVGIVWFRSFQKDIYALLNPNEQKDAQDRLLVTESKSLFGSMIDALGNSKAQISDLFNGKETTTSVQNSSPSVSPATTSQPHPLPVSGNR